ncbi:MAG: aldolase [Candidatus Brocadiia bacterium]|nr:MAG: aldolase [Candidatus Brocadiia bacterium]
MDGKKFIDALHDGRRVYGTCIISTSPKWMQALKGVNFDFVFIDTEHIPIDSHQLGWMCHAYRGLGMAPIVRIPSPSPYEASRAIDTGASGVIAPYIETAEQVKELRGAIKLKPLKGKKLDDILEGKAKPEPLLAEYVKNYNMNNAMIVNIESVPAINALDEILAVPGLDAVLIGPNDLTCSLGIPEQYDSPIFDNAVREIIRKAREKNIGAGIHFWPSVEQEAKWAQAGLNLIIHHSDMTIFKRAIQEDLGRLRDLLGDDKAKTLGDDAI